MDTAGVIIYIEIFFESINPIEFNTNSAYVCLSTFFSGHLENPADLRWSCCALSFWDTEK